jgi:hypothetical protein
MTNLSYLPMVIAFVSASLLHGLTRSAAAVQFQDKNLEAALRAMVFDKKDQPAQELTEDDLKKIFGLEAKGKGIQDLKGLEHRWIAPHVRRTCRGQGDPGPERAGALHEPGVP